MNRKKVFLTLMAAIGMAGLTFGQSGQVHIEQDPTIPKLLQLKTELTKEGYLGDRYRIQIFSGDNNKASEVIMQYRNLKKPWTSTLVYETPNYKVWVGNFRNKLEADRALMEIKNTFPAAFRFRPDQR